MFLFIHWNTVSTMDVGRAWWLSPGFNYFVARKQRCLDGTAIRTS